MLPLCSSLFLSLFETSSAIIVSVPHSFENATDFGGNPIGYEVAEPLNPPRGSGLRMAQRPSLPADSIDLGDGDGNTTRQHNETSRHVETHMKSQRSGSLRLSGGWHGIVLKLGCSQVERPG